MIQVPVPVLEPLVQRVVPALVCPHITLLGPFVDRRDVDEDLVRTIRDILAPVQAFEFILFTVGRFGQGLTYLAPEPAEPFVTLASALAGAFPQWPPYGGAFDEVVPHLSIGEALSPAELTVVREQLPISATADEVTLTWWSGPVADVLVRFPLRPLQTAATTTATR